MSDLTVGVPLGCVLGFIAWFLVRYLVAGIYTVNQNERAVKTSFGRAERLGAATTAADSMSRMLDAEERERYGVPQVRVIQPGGPYFKWPWEKVHKVSIATETVPMAWDPTWTIPITGTSVPPYHSQPISKNGYRPRFAKKSIEMPNIANPASSTQNQYCFSRF